MFWISIEGRPSLGIFGNQPDLSRGQFGGLKNRVGNPALEFARHVEEVPDKLIPASGVPASLPKDWLDGCRVLDSPVEELGLVDEENCPGKPLRRCSPSSHTLGD